MFGYGQTEEDDSLLTKEFRLRLRGNPTLIVQYGTTQADAKPVSRDFRRIGQLAVHIGYRREDPGMERYLVDHAWYGASFGYYSGSLWKPDAATNKVSTKAWQFGLNSENGDGYKWGGTSIIPYRSSMHGWTKLITDFSTVTSDSATLLLYEGTFRFGQLGGMGLQVQFLPVVALDGAFKRGVIFPRHLFLKHLGSVLVEEISHDMVNRFIERVSLSSPAAGPIVGFLLHSGITYFLYELRKEDMHWPFSTTSPVTYDTFSIGLRFNL